MAIEIDHINTPEKLGLALRRIRKANSLSQDELSKKIKIRQPTLSEVENGGGTVQTLFKLIQELGINLTISENKKTKSKKNEALDFYKKLESLK